MCSEINKINVHRRELVKKELFPKFRCLCTDDQLISATGLFGDNLADQTKNLDTSKAIQMTSKGQTSGQKSFLYKRGGEKTSYGKQTPHLSVQQPMEVQEIGTNLQRLQEKLHQFGQAKEALCINSHTVSIGKFTYQLKNTTINFTAGKTRKYLNEWKNLTTDKWILETIQGYYVELNELPCQT